MANELVRGMMALVTGDDLTQDASEVPFTPTGTIAATTVQAAVAETNTEAAHLAGTETITGAKTFSVAPVAPGVTAPAATSVTIASPLGAAAADIAVKIGSSVADVSVHASAKVVSVRTGVGGAETEQAFVCKDGTVHCLAGVYCSASGNPASLSFQYGGFVATTGQPQQNITFVPSYGNVVHTTLSVQSYTNPLALLSGQGAGATDVAVKAGTRIADGSVHATAKLLSARVGIGGTEVEKAFVSSAGEYESTVTGSGIVLRSPDGTRWRATISNAGALVVAPA